MTPLTLLLSIKVAVTVPAVVVPFLFLSKPFLDRHAGFGATALVLYRLYGAAILALTVAYTAGLVTTLGGAYPSGVVLMGLASNGGATIALVTTGHWKKTRLLTLFFGLVALGFLGVLAFHEFAMRPLQG